MNKQIEELAPSEEFDSFLTCNTICPRTGESPLFVKRPNGDIAARLNGYAIVPAERWKALTEFEELAKQSEPVAYLKFWAVQIYAGHGNIECDEGFEVCEEGETGVDGSPAFPVFTNPLPQADLVAEIELLRSELAVSDRRGDCFKEDLINRLQQLSAAQADNSELVEALTEFHSAWSSGRTAIYGAAVDVAIKALAAHKARQGKEQQ